MPSVHLNFCGENWCITNERHTKRETIKAIFGGDEDNNVCRCVYIHTCAKRKLNETTSSAYNNTYLPKVSVLDVLSISNTTFIIESKRHIGKADLRTTQANEYLTSLSLLSYVSLAAYEKRQIKKMAGNYKPSITSPEARVRVIEMLDGFLAKSAK